MDVGNYGGSYLKASMADEVTVVRILGVEEGTDYNGNGCLILNLNDEKKWQLKTRDVNALVGLFGKDSDNWLEKAITLTIDEGDYEGDPYKFFVINPYKKGDIQDRQPVKTEAPPVADLSTEDDDLPF